MKNLNMSIDVAQPAIKDFLEMLKENNNSYYKDDYVVIQEFVDKEQQYFLRCTRFDGLVKLLSHLAKNSSVNVCFTVQDWTLNIQYMDNTNKSIMWYFKPYSEKYATQIKKSIKEVAKEAGKSFRYVW